MRQPSARVFAVMAASVLTVTAGALVTAHAAPTEGCAVTYSVGSRWPGGFIADVAVHNLGAPLHGWRLAWSFKGGQRVVQAWGAGATQTGADVTATNAVWNSALGADGTARLGFVATAGGSNPVPSSFTLNGVTCNGAVAPSPTSTPTAGTSPVPTPTATSPGSSTGPSATTTAGTSGTAARPWPPSSTFSNPTIWQDFADGDVIRVGDVYYYLSSNMHYSPGAPILRSYDLVHWEYAGHAIPRLDFSPAYDLNGGRAYIKGTWASFLNYRKSEKKFYWGGCIEFGKSYLYTADSVEGPWQRKSTINNCYYDAGMLIDDDDTMYVSYGGTTINVAQLSKDGTSQVRTQKVYEAPPNVGYIEGSRFYKVNGNYYIFVTRPADTEYVLRSTTGPFGPYTMQPTPFAQRLAAPIPGAGSPHQGGIVQTATGAWYYMAFVDAYPGGRVPVLAPMTWGADGWPHLETAGNAWGTSYPYPDVPRPAKDVKPLTGTETFSGATLGPEWEWNHNPDDTKWSVGNGLTLRTATVTDDLYAARNTLTHRTLGPSSTATITLDHSGMQDGDRAGLAMLRDSSAWIGLKRDGGTTRLVMVNNLTMDRNWNTTGKGSEAAAAPVTGDRIWLRVTADVRPGPGRQANFSYSTDGTRFTPLGPPFVMGNGWEFFEAQRFAVFTYATKALGGSVKIGRFDLTTP